MSRLNKYYKFNLLIFPFLAIALGLSIFWANHDLFLNRDAVMYYYLKNAAAGKVGYGFNVVHNNGISFEGLEPGDILLGGYPGCAYGRFSHAGIYMGNGQVMEGYADLGVTVQPLEHFHNYTEICLLRIDVAQEKKLNAVEYVKKHNKEIFYPLAFKPGDRIWNCTKIMWKAYREQGVELDISNDLWVAPDAFYNSPYASIIREKGIEK